MRLAVPGRVLLFQTVATGLSQSWLRAMAFAFGRRKAASYCAETSVNQCWHQRYMTCPSSDTRVLSVTKCLKGPQHGFSSDGSLAKWHHMISVHCALQASCRSVCVSSRTRTVDNLELSRPPLFRRLAEPCLCHTGVGRSACRSAWNANDTRLLSLLYDVRLSAVEGRQQCCV
jgi:hypothetical protein